MNRSELAMLKASMGDGKDPAASLAAVGAALAAYEKTMPAEGDGEKPPESESDEAKAARAKRAAEVEEEERKKRAAAADLPKAMTMEAVDQRAATIAGRVVGEAMERSALIERNRVRLGEKLAGELTGLPLATVKSLVAARLLDSPAGEATTTTRAAGVAAGVGPLGPMPRDALVSCPAEDRDDTRAALARLQRIMHPELSARPALRIDARGMQLSHVGNLHAEVADYVRQQQALAAAAGR